MKASHVKVFLPLLFLFAGLLCIFLSRQEPIRDFGNYYYGSRMLLDGKFSPEMYTNIHYFNQQISTYSETNFFENYIPVPPFSAIFYLPFCLVSSLKAKFIFNLLSLFAFCWSLFRLLKFLNLNSKALYLLPVVLFFPFYSNIQQGQTYLLILAALFEVYLSSEKNKVIFSSLLIAFIICLKIFPGIILLYFIFKKNWRVLGYTMAFVIILTVISNCVLPEQTSVYYFTSVLPRLFDNDVVGTYYPENQSVYTALLRLFSYDQLANPTPLLNTPLLVVLFESIFYTLVLCFCFQISKHRQFVFFGFIGLTSLLLSRYSTSYSLVLVLPLCLAIIADKDRPIVFLILFIVCGGITAIPNWLTGTFLDFPFVRLCGLLILLVLVIYRFRLGLNYKIFAGLLIPILIFKYFSFPIKDANYFEIQNSKGILYELALKNDSLILKSCLGDKDLIETFHLKERATFSENIVVRNNTIYYEDHALGKTKDNKAQPFLYQNSIVFMSDLNQGLRFYKLRILPL